MQCKMQIQNSLCIYRLQFIGQKSILCKTIFIYLHVVSYPNTKPTWEKIRKQLVINKNDGTVFFLVLFDNIKAELYNIVISVYIYIVIKPNCLYNFQCKINSCSSYPYHIVCFVKIPGARGHHGKGEGDYIRSIIKFSSNSI